MDYRRISTIVVALALLALITVPQTSLAAESKVGTQGFIWSDSKRATTGTGPHATDGSQTRPAGPALRAQAKMSDEVKERRLVSELNN